MAYSAHILNCVRDEGWGGHVVHAGLWHAAVIGFDILLHVGKKSSRDVSMMLMLSAVHMGTHTWCAGGVGARGGAQAEQGCHNTPFPSLHIKPRRNGV